MNDTVTSVWTAKDEAILAELTERRERVMRERRDPIVAAIANGLPSLPPESIADYLIGNADRFRDLLAPFDSNMRTK